MRIGFPRWCTTLALVALLAPASAAAQETASETLRAGRKAISFQPFDQDGSTTIGYWRVRDPNTRFGWMFNGSIATDRTEIEDTLHSSATRLTFGVGPELRRYWSHSERIAPFGFAGARIGAGFRWDDPLIGDDDSSEWTATANGRIGIGVEFFPVRNFGLDAQIGVAMDASYRPHEDLDGHTWGISLGTSAASLGGSFYF